MAWTQRAVQIVLPGQNGGQPVTLTERDMMAVADELYRSNLPADAGMIQRLNENPSRSVPKAAFQVSQTPDGVNIALVPVGFTATQYQFTADEARALRDELTRYLDGG